MFRILCQKKKNFTRVKRLFVKNTQKTMRHGIAFRKLGRPTDERLQMLRNLVTSLVKNESVETTVARGKEMKRIAEKVYFLSLMVREKEEADRC